MEELQQGQKRQKQVDRRFFLKRSFGFLAGALLGLDFVSAAAAAERPVCPIVSPPSKGSLPHSSSPRIALIIDDIGSSVSRARAFVALGIPLTFSILPRLRYSRILAEEIQSIGHEIMLHQPMEPYSHDIDPGPGALYVNFRGPEITDIVEDNIAQIPQATGVNNHMGSRFTSCPKKVAQALRVVKERDLFFVDSLTTCHSKAYEMARRLHMRAASRNIFLDDELAPAAIRLQLRRLKAHALTYGAAIGIGHPHIPTLAALHEFKWELEDKGSALELVPVSHLL